MEITASSVASSVKVALQVISNHTRPVVEIYQEFRNREGAIQEVPVTDSQNKVIRYDKHTHQEIFVQFTLVNIGGIRAEDIVLKLDGDLSYMSNLKRLSDIWIFNGEVIPQLVPAQSIFLCKIDEFDLYNNDTSENQSSVKARGFSISINYNAPNEGFNRVRRFWSSLWGNEHQYSARFTFKTSNLNRTDLPPIEYR